MPRPPRAVLGLALLAAALAAAQTGRFALTGSVMSGDAVYYYCHLRSLGVDRDLDSTNEIRHFLDARSSFTGRPKIGNRLFVDPSSGRLVNKYPIGTAILLLPFFQIAHAAATGLAALGVPVDDSGYGAIHQLAAAWGTAAYAALGIWLFAIAAIRAGVTAADAWLGALAMAFATPFVFYVVVEPLFSHAISATAVAGLVVAWQQARRTRAPRDWLLAGLAAGVMTMVRYQDAAFLIVPGLDLMASARRAWRPAVMGALCLAAGALAGAGPQLAAHAVLYGHPFRTGYAAEPFLYLTSPWLLYSLVSADTGLLRWSPLVAPALAGLAIAAWQRRPVGILGLIAVVLQWYLVSAWYFVTQGHTFGNRMLVGCTVFFVVGLSVLLDRARETRGAWRALVAVCAAGVLLTGLLIFLWGRGAIGPLSE